MLVDQIEGVQHVALIVDDLEAAFDFYENTLGFRRAVRPDFGFAGAWYTVGGQQIHIFPGDVASGRHHIALQVTDLEASITALEGANVKVTRSQHYPGAGRQAFFKDPSGNRIELNQPDR